MCYGEIKRGSLTKYSPTHVRVDVLFYVKEFGPSIRSSGPVGDPPYPKGDIRACTFSSTLTEPSSSVSVEIVRVNLRVGLPPLSIYLFF